MIQWHGKEQRYYAADMLKNFCYEVFISCRTEQANNIDDAYKTLPDTFLNMGPFGGILSAMRCKEITRGWWLPAICLC